ncbi:MAG: carboxypeptidase [Frankiales bacterium]|nr:carboxypeptidase [Frankiales bacterium]
MDRRRFLQSAALAGAALVVPRAAASAAVPTEAPRTGFEQSGGAAWTTHEQEVAFLAAVAQGSRRVRLETIGRTEQGRPLQLMSIGTRDTRRPTVLLIGSQHGNEPAGRETALALARDLAFTTDPVLVRQLAQQSVLVLPSANPDGRQANTRENSAGVDINRDHLALTQPESRAIAAVLRDRGPDLVLDLHEYGPSVPVLYDDEVLYLWPRNLNVDQAVHDLSKELAEDFIAVGARAAGFTADEYGLYKAGPQEVTQTAGDQDEGICRNAVGLRHSLGILIESAVSMDATNGPGELTSQDAVNLRRVASQTQVTRDTLRFLREKGGIVRAACEGAGTRKAAEGKAGSAPVFFGGADNDPPEDAQVVDPPPLSYSLSTAQFREVADVLALHGVRTTRSGSAFRASMGQSAEPVIALLLDARGQRHIVAGTPLP